MSESSPPSVRLSPVETDGSAGGEPLGTLTDSSEKVKAPSGRAMAADNQMLHASVLSSFAMMLVTLPMASSVAETRTDALSVLRTVLLNARIPGWAA